MMNGAPVDCCQLAGLAEAILIAEKILTLAVIAVLAGWLVARKSEDGKDYIGAHLNGGVRARPVGYDADNLMTLPDGTKSERLVALPCTAEQAAAFHAFVQSKLGEPYDWKAIIGFAAPDLHAHSLYRVICSAFMTAALRACGYFPMPLTVPFHHVSPRDLFLILSSHVQIDH